MISEESCMLKICHISTMTNWGGVERMLVDFLSTNHQGSFAHSLLSTSSSPEILSEVQRRGVPIFEPKRRLRYDPTAIAQMAQWLRAQNVSIAHAYNAVPNAYGNLAALLANTPIFVSSERGTVWRSRSHLLWLNRLAYQRADAVIANSEASKLLVMKRYKVPAQKIRVIHNFVAAPLRVERETVRQQFGLTDEFVIGSIGRLETQKGYTVFVDAAQQVLQHLPNARFILVGGGEEEATLRKQVDDAGIADKFILTGWRSNAREILQSFDLFVSTSMFEPFGNVLVEAAMVGIPVIAPYVDGIPEAVADGVTGKLLRPSQRPTSITGLPSQVVIDGQLREPLMLDTEVLVDTILKFAANQDMRRAYGAAGKTRAYEMFTLAKYVGNVDRLYTDLLEAA